MTGQRLDEIRTGVLRQMERADRNMKLVIGCAAVLELALLSLLLFTVDFKDSLQRLVFLTSILSYSILGLGLVALGVHVTNSAGRIVALLDPESRSR